MDVRHRTRAVVASLAVLLLASSAWSLVWYDRGRLTIGGIQLFQDTEDPTVYYYLPTVPSLAFTPDGHPQLLCLKYVDPDGNASGGILHFLAGLDLPPERVEALEKALRKKVPGAKLAGPVRLLEPKRTAGKGASGSGKTASFRVVSAILASAGEEGGLTRTLIASGHAPLTPGSRAAVAATLDPKGATLLWGSFSGPTSDVSVTIEAEYEARVRGYNAVVTADVTTLYEHFSMEMNQQEGYTKRELRRIVDELRHDNVLKIEVFDRSKSLGLDSTGIEAILDLVTDKLTALMFDQKAGLAKMPEKERAIAKGQVRGRRKAGAFIEFFSGEKDPKYVTDDQFVLKSRSDLKRTTFSINLAHDTTVRVPVYLTGNMRGLYDRYRDDPEVFRVVNLADPAFEVREIHFVLDGAWAARFQDLINWVSVQARKVYGSERPTVAGQLQLTPKDVADGTLERVFRYPRLGETGEDWLGYGYRVTWSFRGHGETTLPAGGGWDESTAPVVTLEPPLTITEAEAEVDTAAMADRGVRRAVVQVRATRLGKAATRRVAVVSPDSAEPVVELAVAADPGQEPQVRAIWIMDDGSRATGPWTGLGEGYVWLQPPQPPEP